MFEYLPRDVQDGMLGARRSHKDLTIVADGTRYSVIRLWPTGFALEEAEGASLRGLVDLYEGAQLLGTCLIVADEIAKGERRFAFKRRTRVGDCPPVDFVRGGSDLMELNAFA